MTEAVVMMSGEDVRAFLLWAPESPMRERARADFEQMEASAAAMREALEAQSKLEKYAARVYPLDAEGKRLDCAAWDKRAAALAADAGSSMLERVREAEKKADPGLWDVAARHLARAEKAEAERDALRERVLSANTMAERAEADVRALRAEVERLRAELEGESVASPPVGHCPKCGAAWYTDVGTCGCGL